MPGILCSVCGHSNEEQARFCGLCGSTVDRTAPPEATPPDLEDLRRILAIIHAVNSTLNLDQVLNLVLDATIGITQGQRGCLILRDDRGELRLRAARAMQEENLQSDSFRFSRRALDLALERGHLVTTVSAQEDTDFAGSQSVFSLALQTIVCIPLKSPRAPSPAAENELPNFSIIGAIYVDSCLPVGFFDPRQRFLIEFFAHSAALAIGNARLYQALESQHRSIQEAALRLESTVLDRTRELDDKNRQLLEKITELERLQNQLVQSEKMALIGTLAGGVAHEINNPMGTILGSAQRILRTPCTDERHRQSAELIQDASRRGQNIVQNLLSFSRRSDTTMKSLDLREVLEDSLSLIGHHLELTSIRIEKDYSETAWIMGNQNEISQVFTNVLLNARDALSETFREGRLYGTIRIRTLARNTESVVEISDDGPGIGHENLPRLFDPFFTTKEPGRGTGLGLSIALGIVQRHGGRIDVESEIGEGCTFRIFFPSFDPAPTAIKHPEKNNA